MTHTHTHISLSLCEFSWGKNNGRNQSTVPYDILSWTKNETKEERMKEEEEEKTINLCQFLITFSSRPLNSHSHSCGDKTESAHFRLAFITTR